MGITTPEIWFPHLGIQIDKLSSIAFSIFGINIYWYGIIIGSGVLIALFLALKEAKRTEQNVENYIDFTIIGIIFCVIGARLYYVIFSWHDYKDNLMKIFAIREGGLAIYGGIIAGIIVAVLYTKKKHMDFWLFVDTAAPSLLLGQIMGRWGNFFNREAFGGYTNNLFAMRYLKEQVSYISPSVLEKVIHINGADYIQVHPTFLYESLWNIGVFILLLMIRRNKKFHGEIFGLYLFGYASGRVWIEGLRTDQLLIGTTQIAVSQVLSAILIIVSIFIMVYRNKKERIMKAE